MRTARFTNCLASALVALTIGCHSHDGDPAPIDDLVSQDAAEAAVARDATPVVTPFEQGAVIHEGGHWLVLATPEEDPSEGDYTALEAATNHETVSRALTPSALAAAPRATRVRVFRGAQWVCDASASTPVGLAVADRTYAADQDGDAPIDRPVDEVWSTGLRVVATRLTATRGDCAQGTWAMDAALDQPRFASAITATPAITDAALRALRASDEGRELARSHADLCESEGTCALSWDARGDVERSIKLFATRDGRRWIFAAVRSTGGCGGFVADLTMIAEVRESGGVVSFDEAAFTREITADPEALVERSRSGSSALEWRWAGDRLFIDATRSVVVERFEVPVFGCPC